MSSHQFVTFWIGNDLFGLDILLIREINRTLEITRVDRAPSYIRGVMNLRGQIVTVIDLGARIGIGKLEMKASSGCVVLKTDKDIENLQSTTSDIHDNTENQNKTTNDVVGFFVDKIGDVITVEDDDIDPTPAHANALTGRFLEGVIKLKDRLIMTLKLSELTYTD